MPRTENAKKIYKKILWVSPRGGHRWLPSRRPFGRGLLPQPRKPERLPIRWREFHNTQKSFLSSPFDLWGSFSFWYYNTTDRVKCQDFFYIFLGRWWELNPLSPKANVSKGATPLYLSLLIGGSPFYLTAICTLIVSYFKGVVKRFSAFFILFSGFGRERR